MITLKNTKTNETITATLIRETSTGWILSRPSKFGHVAAVRGYFLTVDGWTK